MSLDTLVEALRRRGLDLAPGELVALVKAHGLELQHGYRERRPPAAAPGRVEAFEWVPVHCTRCGRELKHPQYLNATPYGRECILKEGLG